VVAELLLEVTPVEVGEESVMALHSKYFLSPLGGTSGLEESQSPEDAVLVSVELVRAEAKVKLAQVEERSASCTITSEVHG